MENTVKQISDMEMAALLTKNNQDEQEAIKGYLEVLKKIEDSGVVGQNKYKQVTEALRDIISDEKEHAQRLTNLVEQITQIPTAKS